jgi:hypothetical protein
MGWSENTVYRDLAAKNARKANVARAQCPNWEFQTKSNYVRKGTDAEVQMLLELGLLRELVGEMPNGINDERNGGLMRVRMNLKQCAWIVAMTLGIGITGGTVRVAASPSPQEQHDQDYSKNKNYQQGMRDGRADSAHNLDHSKTRKFKKDADKKDYETGYQSGHQANSQDHK